MATAKKTKMTTAVTITHDGQTYTGTLRDTGVVVKKGTVAAPITSESPEIEGTRRLRDTLLEAKVLTTKDGVTVFTADHYLPSLTAAARVICGTVVSGRTKWKPAA